MLLALIIALKPAPNPAQAEKFQKFRVRTYSTVTMIGGFILIIWMGHVPLMALIFTIQARIALTAVPDVTVCLLLWCITQQKGKEQVSEATVTLLSSCSRCDAMKTASFARVGPPR